MKLLKILWALPNTLLGLCLLPLILLSGGGVLFRQGCIEASVRSWFWRLMFRYDVSAITLGHFIIGPWDEDDFASLRSHEHVHVCQYELFGPFFLPCYFGWVLYLRSIGKDGYYDNPFEIEAYRE